eukprot:CAMPEP_0206200998 /NCGR_PEP_ID=MMETSP0166-20121206/11248_1 /ASSEMBLY_ACC=CAM_ASM_000260 /TAXON_ID=95228 /ORGANISM="Vannella robusta, Strain DIVA3 518/3/11/1/6" /LENGTH=375 /DNA_ID=CAMNT_0053619513 /DNA_START=95 /DNA_END=1218 /DNA_ORIENTATION=-
MPVLQAMQAVPSIVSDISVVCPTDSPKPCAVKRFAERKEIQIFQPTSAELKTFELPCTTLGDPFDIAVVASYGNLIPEHIITKLPYGGINMHPSYLPYYRGPAPLIRQIEKGESLGGVSVMELHPHKFDMGKLFLQWAYRIPTDMLCKDFNVSCSHHGAHAVLRVLDRYNEYKETLFQQPTANDPIIIKEEIPQPDELYKHLFSSKVLDKLPTFKKGTSIPLETKAIRPTYARPLRTTDGNVNWNACTNLDIYNKWRAFGNKPGLFTYLTWPPNSQTVKRVKLLEIAPPDMHSTPVVRDDTDKIPGAISYNKGDNFVSIQTKEPGRKVKCTKIQFEYKNATDGEKFYNGYLAARPQKCPTFHDNGQYSGEGKENL